MTVAARRKRSPVLGTVVAVAVCMAGIVAAAHGGEIRTWRSVSGSEADARFLKLEYGRVHLETAEGQQFQIGLGKLVPEDRELAKQLGGSTVEAAEQAAATSGRGVEVFRDLIGDTIQNADGEEFPIDKLKGVRKLGILFASHWSRPSTAFTRRLATTYKQLKRGRTGFEVVLASSDRSESAMRSHMKATRMPWYTIPFDAEARVALGQKHRVQRVPHLVIISNTGKVLSENAVENVEELGSKAYEKW